MIEYANKNNIILELNNKFQCENSPIIDIIYSNNIEMLKLLFEYAENHKVLINLDIITF